MNPIQFKPTCPDSYDALPQSSPDNVLPSQTKSEPSNTSHAITYPVKQAAASDRLNKDEIQKNRLLKTPNKPTTPTESSKAEVIVDLTSSLTINEGNPPIKSQWLRTKTPTEKHEFLQQVLKNASIQLQQGTLAIGEHHERPSARAVICDLIEHGAVKKLFLELPDMPASYFDGPLDKTISQHLQKLDRESIKSDQCWTQCSTYLNFATSFQMKKKNPVEIADLINAAVGAGVIVFFIDNGHSHDAKNSASQKAMHIRNQAAGKEFLKHAQENEPGAVILTGAAHFSNPDKSIKNYEGSLQYYAKIPNDQIIDLSN